MDTKDENSALAYLEDAYDDVIFVPRNAERYDFKTRKVSFQAKDVMMPESWDQNAIDVTAEKYMRRKGVPSSSTRVHEEGVPVWLQRSVPTPAATFGGETDSRQTFHRHAGCWTYWGWKGGYFDNEAEALAFYTAALNDLAKQHASPNSPQWFNNGLNWAYGLEGKPEGHYYVDDSGKVHQTSSRYGRVSAHACYILAMKDDLLGIGGIMDTLAQETRIFKSGSGSGLNASPLRAVGEPLSSGGTSSGMMSFLKVYDANAGSVKSGGTTRRAACMRCVNVDHPEIEAFIEWKVTEENKVAALVAGSHAIANAVRKIFAILDAPTPFANPDDKYLPASNQPLREAMRDARRSGIPLESIAQMIELKRQHVGNIEVKEYDTSWTSEAYESVSGQNSNNSVRVSNDFMKAISENRDWDLTARTDGKVMKTVKAAELWDRIAVAAWRCADPGLHYETTINEWATCPEDGPITASNPCVTGDTLVSTADGQFRIDSLVDRSAFVIGSDGQPHFVDKIFPTGRRPVYRLGTKSGLELYVTADHKILTERGDIEACRLVEGDQIRLGNGTSDTFASFVPAGNRNVFDLTEPETNHFVANGIIVHNCSEYLHNDNTACNLASVNLVKMLGSDDQLDVSKFTKTVDTWTTILDITNNMAHLPSEAVAIGTWNYRTIGLGFANMGAYIMRMGHAYDSEEGRGLASAITALMTGGSYRKSAELAQRISPFPRYQANREHMLRILKNHQSAVRGNTGPIFYEKLSITPPIYLGGDDAMRIRRAASDEWDKAVELATSHGVRNAQVTLIAPTGCLTGDTLVNTDRGMMRLRNLGNTEGAKWQDVALNVLTDDGIQKATKFFVNGIDATRRIRTKNGYVIQGTLTHRIKIVDPVTKDLVWKRMADVTPEDTVALAMNQIVGTPNVVNLPPLGEEYWTTDYTTVVPRTMTRDLAEILGYFMGDGSLHAKGLRFCAADTDPEVATYLADLLKRTFNLDAVLTQKTGYTDVSVNSVELTLWWEACGFSKHLPHRDHRGKGYEPHIPDALLATNDPQIYGAFLKGLYEADGTVTNGNPSLSTGYESFEQDIKQIMLVLGIPTKTFHTISGWGQSQMNVIRVRNMSYVNVFTEKIGFISSRKASRVKPRSDGYGTRGDNIHISRELVDEHISWKDAEYQANIAYMVRNGGAINRSTATALLDRPDCSPKIKSALGFFYDGVITNEDGGEQLTYDLSVPANVTYVANGFVSHNTIGIQMSCDTTGPEPDFALVKYKSLAGGGNMKIVNVSVRPALEKLGYAEDAIERIEAYLRGVPAFTSDERKRMSVSGIAKETIEAMARDLKNAYNVEGIAGMHGVDLRSVGFTDDEITTMNVRTCGHMTVEGSPDLRPEHLPIFDCATPGGTLGKRFIAPEGHVTMLAAIQPFVSGAISKTVNLPSSASIADIKNVYELGHKLGLKAVALYRDGSKLSQPLTGALADLGSESGEEALFPTTSVAGAVVLAGQMLRGSKQRMPKRRSGYTQEFTIGGHKLFMTTGEYEDGSVGEIFLNMSKEGAAFRALMNNFAIAVSVGLQYGVPLGEYVDKFVATRFEPNGTVQGHENIKMATSLLDAVFRDLSITYEDDWSMANIRPDDLSPTEMDQTKAPPSMHTTNSHISMTETDGPKADTPAVSDNSEKTRAKQKGYTGDMCGSCGSSKVKNNGKCTVCEDCGSSNGCS